MKELSARHAEIAAAAASLNVDDFTADERPNVTAINRVLVANGHTELTAEERNEAWDAITIAARQAAADPDVQDVEDDSPNAVVMVNVTRASANPVLLIVNGVRRSLHVGQPKEIFRFMLDALNNSDVSYEIVKPAKPE